MAVPHPRYALLFCLLITLLFIFSHAWVAEDAFITFRVVDHFVNSYGLRWNIDERVQVYTHPLWMLLHIPFHAIFGNIFLTTIGISIACFTASVLMLMRTTPASASGKVVLVLMPLAFSSTMQSFAASGLEPPLTFLLLAAFYHSFWKKDIHRALLLAALCILTRLDNVLLLLPALLWIGTVHLRDIRPLKAAVAFSPLIAWCLFSLIYYGFIFPNTKYAKLGTGLPPEVLWEQGTAYLKIFLYYDGIGFALIMLTLLVACYHLLKLRRSDLWLPALGVALHVVYVISVGGDFMAGRFFAPGIFLSVCILHRAWHSLSDMDLLGIALAQVLALCAAQLTLSPRFVDRTNFQVNHGIVDERLFYFGGNSLLIDSGLRIRTEPSHYFRSWGHSAVKDPAYKLDVKNFSNIGMYGFYAPPEMIIIDGFALTDPFLARMPMIRGTYWRIGHFYRNAPTGYLETRRSEKFFMANHYRDSYETLRLVTSGDIWSRKRLSVLLRLNLPWLCRAACRMLPSTSLSIPPEPARPEQGYYP